MFFRNYRFNNIANDSDSTFQFHLWIFGLITLHG